MMEFCLIVIPALSHVILDMSCLLVKLENVMAMDVGVAQILFVLVRMCLDTGTAYLHV